MATPRVFISYAWESDALKAWVKQLAARLRQDGVESVLDQWELAPGDQLPTFMERSVWASDFVLVICTPVYRDKSDNRKGGVGYEGDIMTAEIATGADRRKFIPLLRETTWLAAAPSWLRGSYYLDFRGELGTTDHYPELISTLHGTREGAPALGSAPTPNNGESEDEDFALPAPIESYLRIRSWIAAQRSKYPVASDPARVGWYSAEAKSGAGYFWDEVLEYRVWIRPHGEGPELDEEEVFYCAFPSYEEALEFSESVPGAEEPLALIRQWEHVNEPEEGHYEHVVGERIAEWRVEWLKTTKRQADSIPKFLADRLKGRVA